MSRWSTLKKMWKWLLQSRAHDGQEDLLAMLCQEYAEETRHSIQFKAHAERMHYPQFRERLLKIAEEEEKHAQWLKEKIIGLGGEIPRILFTAERGLNSWEQLRLDLEEEKRCVADLTEKLATSKEIDLETAEDLGRMLGEEKRHRESIRDMLMRSDPQAVWPV